MMKSMGQTREEFLARVRQPLGRSQVQPPDEPVPEVDPSLMRLASGGDDLVAMFAEQAQAIGMTVHRCEAAGAGEAMEKLMDEIAPRSAVVGLSPGQPVVDVRAVLAGRAIEMLDWDKEGGVDVSFEADLGITDVHGALAESGTLICCADRSHGRVLSLAPPTHLALVRGSEILPDMLDYWARLKGIPGEELPSSQTFITGPSKTADIEGELITGVHGPGVVHILVVDDA